MLPDLSVLFGLLLGLLHLAGSPENPSLSALGTAASVALGLLMARATAWRGLEALRERPERGVGEASARWVTAWALLAWLACLVEFEWGAWVHAYVPRTLWLVRIAVLILPGLVLWCGAWWYRAPLEAAMAQLRGAVRGPPTGWDAVRRGLRRNAVAFLPLFVILGVTEAIWVLGALGVAPLATAARWLDTMELLNLAVVMGIVLITLPLVPWLIARMVKAQPLPDGRLRDVLQRAAASLGLRYRDILLWPTGGRVLNAMVVGVTPRSRRIFFTDGLLDALTEDETVAVFFHEAGHARRHHLETYLLIFFSLALLMHAGSGLFLAIGIPTYVLVLLHLALLWFVLLGSISRRFEREADVFGAQHAAFQHPEAEPVALPGVPALLPRGTAAMMSALDRLRQIVGPMPSHRHGPVESRIAFLAALATNPETGRRWRRELRALRIGIVITAVAAIAATICILPREIATAKAQIAMDVGAAAYDKAFALEHPATQPSADHPIPSPQSREHWEEAYANFSRAAAHLEGRDSEMEQRRRLLARLSAADTALHGLRDGSLAQREFAQVLESTRTQARDDVFGASVRFQAHIELGRLAAQALVASSVDPERAVQQAQAHLQAADDLRTSVLEPAGTLDESQRSWFRERANLLRFTLKARVAARDPEASSELRIALRWLGELTQGTNSADEWVELRDDARLELRSLR